MTILPLICIAGAILTSEPASTGAPALVSESQKHMGTEFTIQIAGAKGRDTGPALRAAFAKIAALDKAMTDYDPESELSKLGATAPHASPVRVSPDLGAILSAACQASEETDGAFDVTVGSITKLWRQARRQKKIPDAERLKIALASVGYQHLKVAQAKPGEWTVQLTQSNLRLDLGGIAQGYAADAALAILRDHGFPAALVNASGDIVVGDAPPGSDGWKIGLVAINPKQPPTKFVRLQRCAISTSGDAFQFVEFDGRRYSHIVDPKTGLGLTTPMAVTVIAPTGTVADAYASALCVLGPDKAQEKRFHRGGELSALLIRQTPSGVQTTDVNDFGRYLMSAP